MSLKPPDLKAEQPELVDQGQPIPVKIVKNEELIRVTDRRFWVQPESSDDSDLEEYSFKPSYVESLEQKLKESDKKLEEMMTSFREAQAEASAEVKRSRERIQNEYTRRLDQAKSDLVSRFLDILENFERALAAAEGQSSFESLLDGVRLIRSQFLSVLTDMGVKEVPVEGGPFNPELAEAVGLVEVPSEEQDQRVIEVVGKGYRLDETLIRPARVRVGRFSTPASGRSTA